MENKEKKREEIEGLNPDDILREIEKPTEVKEETDTEEKPKKAKSFWDVKFRLELGNYYLEMPRGLWALIGIGIVFVVVVVI